MPFRSHAQRAYFYAKKNRGEISQQVIDEWEADTPRVIPPRLHKKLKKLGEWQIPSLTKESSVSYPEHNESLSNLARSLRASREKYAARDDDELSTGVRAGAAGIGGAGLGYWGAATLHNNNAMKVQDELMGLASKKTDEFNHGLQQAFGANPDIDHRALGQKFQEGLQEEMAGMAKKRRAGKSAMLQHLAAGVLGGGALGVGAFYGLGGGEKRASLRSLLLSHLTGNQEKFASMMAGSDEIPVRVRNKGDSASIKYIQNKMKREDRLKSKS